MKLNLVEFILPEVSLRPEAHQISIVPIQINFSSKLF